MLTSFIRVPNSYYDEGGEKKPCNLIEVVHIKEFCKCTGRSIQSMRYLCSSEAHHSIRPMKHIYERSRLLIPMDEIRGYPFVRQGKRAEIYHYVQSGDEKWVQKTCPECTVDFSVYPAHTRDGTRDMERCEGRLKADSLVLGIKQLDESVLG